jgi:hypothetical protein
MPQEPSIRLSIVTAAKVKYQADVMLAESDRLSTHNQTYNVDGEEEEEEEEEVGGGGEDEDDKADLFPPPVM